MSTSIIVNVTQAHSKIFQHRRFAVAKLVTNASQYDVKRSDLITIKIYKNQRNKN